MPRIYVIDVPEFAGLVEAAQGHEGVEVTSPRRGYRTISSDLDLEFTRNECGFKPALWYSCLSGGIDGEIIEYGRDRLRVTDRKN